MKGLEGMNYVDPVEAVSEKFHMSPELLRALNPGKDFSLADEEIIVAAVSTGHDAKVAFIDVDKIRQTVTAYNKNHALVAFYPATVGSGEKPSPTGTRKVKVIQRNPTYHYNPEYQFKGVRSKTPFVIAPGPNNPVGSTWVGLNEKGYGIHGTPDPSKVSKSESHGCVRLTNWDARDLADRVTKNTTVSFRGK
jgi:lipoprotein-anchoring transpeptidase ErfK/SrfK